MKFALFSIVFALFVARLHANCDNSCSGHGTCSFDDVCKCYDNWGVGLSHDTGDCSDRICPYELAWVDTPNKVGAFHKYAECANRGICNRETGECACFDGYEGKACQRTSCPNDCSGHGTCEYIDDMYYAATWNEYSATKFRSDPVTFAYRGWDTRKVRGCVCDATYGDVDCSKRMCPYGNDVLDTKDSLLVTEKNHVQQIFFPPSDKTGNPLTGKTFALTFKSRLNETFTTIPIVFDDTYTADFVTDIQRALLTLPNRVIDGVSVTAFKDVNQYLILRITFTGNAVQGPQHLLTVENYECGAGCTPRLDGLGIQTRIAFKQANVTADVKPVDYNSYECGRRGKCDYTTGLCQCFTGYTGDNCNTLTTLT